MAYPIAENVLNLFLSENRQLATITFSGTEESITITESDIMQNGLTIDRYCASGNKIEIGSAVAAELSLRLNNQDGRFSDVNFEGAELFVQVGTADFSSDDPDTPRYYIPMGYFTIDNAPRPLSTISIKALDRMVMFDKSYTGEIVFPITLANLLTYICNVCNVELSAATDANELTNAGLIINEIPLDNKNIITYRQILQWVAELSGTCAYIDWYGDLRLEWDNQQPTEITASDRYSSDISENDITITGINFVVDSDLSTTFGSKTYAFNISSNLLLPSDLEVIGNNLFSDLVGFSYRPFTAMTKPLVHLWPLDSISITDRGGISQSTMLTHVTFSLNKQLSLKSVGLSKTIEGYAKQNPLTKQESVIIESVRKALNEQLNDRAQSILSLNETMAGAFGLYSTVITQTDGSQKFYYHSNSVLQDSKNGDVIYTMNAGGFSFCTTGWNNGHPVWQYGITKDGNAIYRNIYANGIEVSNGATDYTAKITPEAFEIWFRAIKCISANGEESMFTKIKVNSQLEVGKIRMIPHLTNGVLVGSDIVFVD